MQPKKVPSPFKNAEARKKERKMLNQVVMVGRLTSDLEIKEVDGKKVCEIILAIPRSYKNSEGIYETDFVPVKLWNGVAENTAEYCEKGGIIGVKGRIETEGKDDGESITYSVNIVAEKVTYLSSKPRED